MNHKLFTTLSGLSISSALLVAGLMPGGHAAGLADGNAGGVVQAIETDAVEATEEAVAPATRKHRRGRASLSMPYFSFAQSLRPQG